MESWSVLRIREVAVKRRVIESKNENSNVQIPMNNNMLRTILFLVIGVWSLVISSGVGADGPVPVGAQPPGGLSGKIVYTHGGHGITAANKRDGAWTFQRGPGNEMIEDLGNIDQMAFFADYLFR